MDYRDCTKSKVFDKIVVTTDENKNIKKYSKYNVESLIRPKELSKEKYGIDEVMKYTLKKLNIKSEYALLFISKCTIDAL